MLISLSVPKSFTDDSELSECETDKCRSQLTLENIRQNYSFISYSVLTNLSTLLLATVH